MNAMFDVELYMVVVNEYQVGMDDNLAKVDEHYACIGVMKLM